MGKIYLKGKIVSRTIDGKRKLLTLLDNKKFRQFNSELLSLGDIRSPSEHVEALAAVFDLSGFTKFCSQVDWHLAIPTYLGAFLEWLFDEIKKQLIAKDSPTGKALWAELPFLAKFLGDGVLFLWDTDNMNDVQVCNIVVTLRGICLNYKTFYREIRKEVAWPPKMLRCGIARGRVCSVGDGDDYVGPCINIASRLQKLSLLTFCFPRKGFDIDEYMYRKLRVNFVEKRVMIPGIRGNELVWVLKEEFKNLPKEEKVLFREP